MRKYRIFSGELLIGESELEHHDEGMNVYTGKFHPAGGYASVKHVFQLFGRATADSDREDDQLLKEYFQARDKLDLRVLDDKNVVLPSGAIQIYDYSFDPEIGEDYQIEVLPQ